MQVRSFILSNGQEIVANLVAEPFQGDYIVRNPLVVHMMRDAQGMPSLGFAPLSMIRRDNADVTIFKHALTSAPAEVEPDVEKSYVESTTGLSLPPSQGNILLG